MSSPKPNTAKDKKVLELHYRGISFSDISHEMKEDIHSIYRRYRRVMGSLFIPMSKGEVAKLRLVRRAEKRVLARLDVS